MKVVLILLSFFVVNMAHADQMIDLDQPAANYLKDYIKKDDLLFYYCPTCNELYRVCKVVSKEVQKSLTNDNISLYDPKVPGFNVWINCVHLAEGTAKNGRMRDDFSCGGTPQSELGEGDAPPPSEYYCAKKAIPLIYNYSSVYRGKFVHVSEQLKNEKTLASKYVQEELKYFPVLKAPSESLLKKYEVCFKKLSKIDCKKVSGTGH